MGMYTEVFARAEISLETYRFLYDVVSREDPLDPTLLDKHPFWTLPRWGSVFWGESYYFPLAYHFELEYSDISKTSYISFRSSLKNYNGEIESFFDWLNGVTLSHGFLGYSLYEEADVPTLYYKEHSS